MAFACVAGVRLFLTVYLAAAALLFPQPDLHQQYGASGVELLDSGWEGLFLGVWQREDALWYEKIATVGYSSDDMTPQLFPLFPMVVRAIWLFTGIHPVAAGIAVSEASLLAALYLLHRLLLPSHGVEVTNRTLVYLSLFPSAFFLHGPFSESLMLMLAILAFSLVGRQQWVAAAAVAYLAGLARPQGMLLGAPLALRLVAAGRKPSDWRSFGWARSALLRGAVLTFAPLLGLATFVTLVDTPWNKPGASGGVGPMAHQSLAVPGTALLNAAQQILAGVAYPIDLFDFVLAILFLLLTLACLPRLEVGYTVYAALFLVAPLSRFSPVFPLMSFSRFVLLLFPCFVVLAIWGRRKWVHLTVIFLWLWWLAVWSFKFYTGYFVG